MNTLENGGSEGPPTTAGTSFVSRKSTSQTLRRPTDAGRTAVWQARLALLVMVNIAQLWILSATIEAALAGEYKQLLPLISASAICWAIALTIYLWWKPAPSRRPKAG